MASEIESRKRLLFRNGVYSLLSWLLPLFTALIVTPIIVKGLGHEIYGLYAVILGFITYSFTFGIGKAAAKYVAEYRATEQTEKISEMVSAVLWISLTFGLIAVLITAFTARYIVVDILLIPREMENTAVVALHLASGSIFLLMISLVFQNVLQGLHRFDRFVLLSNLNGVFLNLGSVTIVLSGFGIIELLVWNVIVVTVSGILFYLSARRLLTEFTFRFAVSRDLWVAAWRYSGSIIAYQIFSNMLILLERGWIVRKFGTESLTFYVVPMTLCIYFHAFISSLVIVLFPHMNEMLDDRDKLTRLYRTATKVVLILTAFFVPSSIIAGKTFLSVWISPEFAAASYPVLVVSVGSFAIMSMTVISWQIIESFRAAELNALAALAWLAISAPLIIIFSDDWNIFGVGLARMIGGVVFLALIFYVERKILGGITLAFWPPFLARIIVAVIFAGAVEWLLLKYLSPTWFALGLVGFAGLGIYLAALYIAGFFDEEEKLFLKSLVPGFAKN